MPTRFLVIKPLFFVLVALPFLSNIKSIPVSESRIDKSNFYAFDKISVRESTSELQISVGDRIFVFGKSRGTLDKVKVGMHVLPFAQDLDSNFNPNSFSSVSWKKLKDGSIQIQSSYKPWPNYLTWTVYDTGQLKMEASGPPDGFQNTNWLGLGFNFPDQSLNQVFWNSAEADFGQWKNLNYVPMADPDVELDSENQGFFHPIKSVRMEFETMILDVTTETTGVFFGLGGNQNFESNYPQHSTDMVFLFNQPHLDSGKILQSPSDKSLPRENQTKEQLVLWFHFQ